MLVINARNVEEALSLGTHQMVINGEPRNSRAGSTLVIPCPVTTVYERPWERVLVDPVRDANPFFHLMEALWILEGRKDVNFLSYFNSRMVEYSDDGHTFNAPYGFRMRAGVNSHKDQIEAVIHELITKPDSRQAVLQIWDDMDLGKDTKDKACNMSVVLRIRHGELDITVYNRSNDMLWGAYGANAVQFSMLQEYIAARVGVGIGRYWQVSNDFHVYTSGPGGDLWKKIQVRTNSGSLNTYANLQPHQLTLMKHVEMDEFDRDLEQFFRAFDYYGYDGLYQCSETFQTEYFNDLVVPMLMTHFIWKNSGKEAALQYVDSVAAIDWRMAATMWLNNRKG